MRSGVSRLWREPLLHFLLLGLLFFLYYDLTGGNVETAPKRVHVARDTVQQLAANFERTWSRPPTQTELDALIEGYVREEIFYREALAMGLDQDDALVRRRLRMKLEFMLEDLSAQEVDDAVLESYLRDNAERFRIEAEISFIHVYLNPDLRPDFEVDAAELLARLQGGADPDTVGDTTLAPLLYRRARQSDITRDFGTDFAAAVTGLPSGAWGGPLYSPFGVHLVRVEERLDERVPALAEVREQVLREYSAAQSKLQKDIAYRKLRNTYAITVEATEDIPAGDTNTVSEDGSVVTQ